MPRPAQQIAGHIKGLSTTVVPYNNKALFIKTGGIRPLVPHHYKRFT